MICTVDISCAYGIEQIVYQYFLHVFVKKTVSTQRCTVIMYSVIFTVLYLRTTAFVVSDEETKNIDR